MSVGKAQFVVGAKLGYNYVFAGIGMPAVGFYGEKGIEGGNRNYSTRVGTDFCIPKTLTSTRYANGYSSIPYPSQMEITVTDKVSLIQINADGKMYFGDGGMEDGGMYGFLGAGACLAGEKTTFPSYDDVNYDAGARSGEVQNEKFFQFMMRGGLGFEKQIDKLGIFGEVVLSIPANNVNGVYTDVNISATPGLNLGVRFNLN